MSKRKECLAILVRPAPCHLRSRWRAASLTHGWRGLLTAPGVVCMGFMLAACDTTHFEPYDYDKGERAKLQLPKGSKVELEGRRFLLKKEIDFPLLGK